MKFRVCCFLCFVFFWFIGFFSFCVIGDACVVGIINLELYKFFED